jgi:DNA-binding protein HU-beta
MSEAEDLGAARPVERRRGRLPARPAAAGRGELVDLVAQILDTTKADAGAIVDGVGRAIVELAALRQLVRVPRLGNFRVLATGPREGRNPRTGEGVPIAPGRRVTFRAALGFKAAVNAQRGRQR